MKERKTTLEQLLLLGIICLAAFLRFYRISDEGYGNLYYAAAVKSMSMGFRNFLYAAFDPGGFISVDKPPVGLWLECLSAAIFGFKGWALILPQAISGIVSVWLIHNITREYFSGRAGLTAAFFLAITPVFTAVNRNNTIDSLFILVLLTAAWVLLKSVNKNSLRDLMLSSVLVGIGFNIKMLQAYMVLPAFYLTYFIFSKANFRKKVIHLFAATTLLLAVSFSWSLIVDLTPENKRPIVANSCSNSMLDLIIGHNALKRFSSWEMPAGPESGSEITTVLQGDFAGFKNDSSGIAGPPPPMMRSHLIPEMETGKAGVFRLFNKQLSGQVSWFFPVILFGILIWIKNIQIFSLKNSKQNTVIFLWLCWIMPLILYFSFTAGLFHRYYLSMLAPPVASLAGIALIDLLYASESDKRTLRLLLPGALMLSGILYIRVLMYFPDWNTWLVPLVFIFFIIIITALIFNAIKSHVFSEKLKTVINAATLIALTILPFIWSLTPAVYGSDHNLPYAGPGLSETAHSFGNSKTEKLIKFLKENRRGEKYLVAAPSAILLGSKLILDSSEPVVTLGGFNGEDETVTIEQLKLKITNGKIRFFLIEKGPPPGLNNNTRRSIKHPGMKSDHLRSLYRWIALNGKLIQPEKWQEDDPLLRSLDLFECTGAEDR